MRLATRQDVTCITCCGLQYPRCPDSVSDMKQLEEDKYMDLERAIFQSLVTMPEPETNYAWVYTDAVLKPFAQDCDLYDLMMKGICVRRLRETGAVAFTTAGWGAPADWDGMPSACPDRRRLNLTLLVSTNEAFSVARFVNDDMECVGTKVVDGSGPLSQAVFELQIAAKRLR